MKRVLVVDDDALVLRLYRDGLARQDLEIETAADGLAAIKALNGSRPDLMVLDLTMPRMSGVDVLKFVRSQPALASLPVVVLSNSYMDDLAREAAEIGVQTALLKASCSPGILAGVIHKLLAGRHADTDPSLLLAVTKPGPAIPAPKTEESSPTPVPAAQAEPAAAPTESAQEAESRARAARELRESSAGTRAALHQAWQAANQANTPEERGHRLQDLFRNVRSVAARAGVAQWHDLARITSAFEACLFEVQARPSLFNASMMRTTSQTLDCLDFLWEPPERASAAARRVRMLVVDDDAQSNRMVLGALQRAGLDAETAEDSLVGWQWLNQRRYDLLLLGAEMGGLNGFELSIRARNLPGYEKTPVILLVNQSDFDRTARKAEGAGNDLIAKPVFQMELALKALVALEIAAGKS